MADRFPDYDVLAKRDTPSWNEQTRRVIAERLLLALPEGVLSQPQAATLARVVARICPDPDGRAPTTTLAMVAHKIASDGRDGWRDHRLPGTREAWLMGLDAIDAEARARFDSAFTALADDDADLVLRAISEGDVRAAEWADLPPKLFWSNRVLSDCVSAHWAQPSLWSVMGFGGPASPRGYVRLETNRRDPWEAEEADTREKGLPPHRAR